MADMKGRIAKMGAVCLLLLMVSTAVVQPVMAAQAVNGADSGSNDGGDCGCCGRQVEELKGEDKNKVVSEALSKESVKTLRSKLLSRGYTPKVDTATAKQISVGDGSSVSTSVTIFFKQKGGNRAAIVYRLVDGTETTHAVIETGEVVTVLSETSEHRIGPASELQEPLQILAENGTYQEIYANMTNQGYSVQESNATILINETSNVATVIVPVEGKNGSIIGAVDIDAKTTLMVKDPTWTDCWVDCMLDVYGPVFGTSFEDIIRSLAGTICGSLCGICLIDITRASCLLCVGCIGGTALACAVDCSW